MHVFKDAKGGARELSINIGAVRKIKAATGIDLADPLHGDRPTMAALTSNVLLMFDVLAAALGIKDEQAEELLGEPTAFNSAVDALFAEWRDFFHRFGRAELAAAVERQLEIARKAASEMATTLAAMSGASSGSAPGSSG